MDVIGCKRQNHRLEEDKEKLQSQFIHSNKSFRILEFLFANPLAKVFRRLQRREAPAANTSSYT
jgi:hypothetical protein